MTSRPIDAVVLVLAKAPRPGFVKTRLTPPYTHQQAATIAAAALHDTLDAVAAVSAAQRVLVMEGDATNWRRPGFEVLAQRGAGLDDRITNAFDDAWSRWRLPALLVGMDTPQVPTGQLTEALTLLAEVEPGKPLALLGFAADGGFWSLGLGAPVAGGVRGVPMSTDRTGAETEQRLVEAGLRVHRLAEHVDVDDAESAAVVARLAPDTAFARAYAQLVPTGLTA